MVETIFDVVGIGNAIVDILAHVDDTFLIRQGLNKGTMTLIDSAAADRLYAAMPPAIERSGGSAANTLAGVASFGGRGAFIGRVKDDPFGRIFTHDMRAGGLTFDVPPAPRGASTARCLIAVTSDAQRTMGTHLGACVELGPEDVSEPLIASARVTYLEGYLWDPPRAKDAFRKAVRVAQGAKRSVALSLSDPFCVDRHRAEFKALVEQDVEILFANEAEIISLTETADFDSALQAIRGTVRLAALTRSEKGAIVLNDGEVHVIDAARVREVVDTTGAGDLFAAGFLFGHARGLAAAACGQLGALAAAEVIGHLGARPDVALSQLARQRGLLP
ncbi:MAG: adenosine kinase [Alphaproteobacteria bacterium]|nr:adenosine kinase [Alphaproteobacteria bacterium]